MIVTMDGRVKITGNKTIALTDLTITIKAVYEGLLDDGLSDEDARKAIANCGRMAFMDDDELVEEFKNELNSLIQDLMDN
jgi:hypothetical protein